MNRLSQYQVLAVAQQQIIERVKLEVARANQIFGLNMNPVIKTDLTGASAGLAGRRNGQLFTNINAQMMTISESNWWEILDNTISHEVAHLVDYATRGRSDHSAIWKAIHKRLGGSAERCHTMDTIKRGGSFKYVVEGKEVTLSATQHKRVIDGTTYSTSVANGRRATIDKTKYVGPSHIEFLTHVPTRANGPENDIVVSVPAVSEAPKEVKAPYPKAPALTAKVVPSSSKRDQAAALFVANPKAARKDLIAMMVEIGLTAAGASTYISNFKTGKWAI